MNELDHHPINAAREVLATYPSDVHEFVRLLDSRVQPTGIRDNAEALTSIERCESDINQSFATGAVLSESSSSPRWAIEWAQPGWEVLIGHLYMDPEKPGEFDVTSPLLLINRNTRRALYGAELVPLAKRVLAYSLLYDATHQR